MTVAGSRLIVGFALAALIAGCGDQSSSTPTGPGAESPPIETKPGVKVDPVSSLRPPMPKS